MKTKLGGSAFGLGWLVLAPALAVTCKGYEVDRDFANTGGSSMGGGEDGGDGGTSGASGKGGSGDGPGGNGPGGEGKGGVSGSAGEHGGSAGAEDGSGNGGSGGSGNGGSGGSGNGGSGGSGNGGTSGESGGGAGGDSGDGSGPTTTPEPGVLGAVGLLVGGVPRCGGSLITNDWVLTADQCVASTDALSSLEVGFGMDASNFQQTRRVIEVQRFPGNDGTDENRGRDLLLLGVEHPFEIDGRTSGYYRPVWHLGPEYLMTPQRCIGWDLRVSATSPTSTLHEESMAPFAFDRQVTNGVLPAGNRVWWLNTSADPEQGVLPMHADAGSACFLPWFDVLALGTVHSGNPPLRRNTQPNVGREAYSVALGEGEIHKWLRTELFDSTNTTIELAGSAGGCAKGRDRLELFGRRSDGKMAWWTWEGRWTEREALAAPNGTSLSGYLPGAYCTKAGGIELFATSIDGSIWWQRMNSAEEWSAQWQRVNDATTPVDSGIAVTGVLDDHFYVFARASTLELRYAEFNGGWSRSWNDLGGLLTGTPSVRMAQEGRIDVFARNIYDDPYQMWMSAGTWMGWVWIQPTVTSDPAVVSWGHNHLDILTRSQAGTLRHLWYQTGWSEIVDTDVPMPPGTPMAIARQPGTTDLFITQENGSVWHGTWPRKPR